MKAIRLPSISATGTPYSDSCPAPSSALHFQDVPALGNPEAGFMTVQVKATSVIRDSLTWSPLYNRSAKRAHPGNDFAGIVTAIHPSEPHFKVGDAVFGMTHADRGGTWAEYTHVKSSEAAIKPPNFSWAEAAALPLSALTADQALFMHGGFRAERQDMTDRQSKILVTGATGGVGWIVLAHAAIHGFFVVAATRSVASNTTSLRELGASDVISYAEFEKYTDEIDLVIDTVGGQALRESWQTVRRNGKIISIDSASYDFPETHRRQGFDMGKPGVKTCFFVVTPSSESLNRVVAAMAEHGIKSKVSKVLPLEKANEAYDLVGDGQLGQGRVILTP